MRRLRGDETFKILDGYENIDRNITLAKEQCRLDIKKHILFTKSSKRMKILSADCVAVILVIYVLMIPAYTSEWRPNHCICVYAARSNRSSRCCGAGGTRQGAARRRSKARCTWL